MLRKTLLLATSYGLFLTAASAQPNYVSSVKLNSIELAFPVAAHQLSQALGALPAKAKQQYAGCTGNYEYSAQTADKSLKFEVFAEDNPQVKSESIYKQSYSFQQLGAIKGRVWLSINFGKTPQEHIMLDGKKLSQPYSLAQFQKDFPQSAQGLKPNGKGTVLIVLPAELKNYRQHPADFEAPYAAHLALQFAGGWLRKLEINQNIAC